MARKKNGKELESFVPVFYLITMFLLLLITVTWGLINKYCQDNNIKYLVYVLLLAVMLIISVSMLVAIQRLSSMDSLTGVLNRETLTFKAVMLFIEKKLDRYSAFFINIKNFKYINRTYTAKGGDLVMRKYAQTLKKEIHGKGYIGRVGGDNFVVLIKSEYEKEFLKFVEKIVIKKTINGEEQIIPVYSRCGVHNLQPDDGVSEVFNYSSIAVNVCKDRNTGYYCYFKPEYSEVLYEFQKVSVNCVDALKNREFVVYYQPKVSTGDCKLAGAEALVRWKTGDNVKAPYHFIPIMEKIGLVPELDFYVFEEVCKSIKKWESEGVKPVKISSNFSKLHLRNDKFIERVEEIIARYEVDKKLIRIEFTESSDVDDSESFTTTLKALKLAGIETTIDDFGTGYSSMSLLFNRDIVNFKLDKAFVDNITTDQDSEFLIKRIIETMSSLGKNLVIEGVETKEQYEKLVSFGCNYVQGYIFDKPLPEEEFIDRLNNPIYSL